MPIQSSQGLSGISGARKISVKSSRAGAANNQLDSSTLALAHGSTRTYEAGLTDNGPNGGNGITVTVTAEGLGAKPALGSTYSGATCIETSDEANVGELAAWSATYSSDANS